MAMKKIFLGVFLLALAGHGRAEGTRRDLDAWYGADSPVFSQAVPAEYREQAAAASSPHALGEAKVRFVRRHLARFLDACLAAADCAPAQHEILTKARALAERADAGVVTFAGGNDPRFTSATVEAHRFAVTRLQPGPVVFNDDQLAPAPSYRVLLALWVHELAHQAGYPDTAERALDEAGAAVAAVVEKQSRDVGVEGTPFEAFFAGEGRESPPLAFSDGNVLLDLTPLVPDALYRIVDIPVLRGLRLSHPHWRGAKERSDPPMRYLEVDLEYRLSRAPDSLAKDTLVLLGRAQFAIPLREGRYRGDLITTSVYDLRVKPLETSPEISLRSLTPRAVVPEGSDLEVTAEIETHASAPVDGAMIALTSDSFLRHPLLVPLRLYWNADEIERLRDGRYRLHFRFRFLPGTPSRTLRVESLFVSVQGMATPTLLLPTFRTTFRYEAKTTSRPLGLVATIVSSLHGRTPLEAALGLQMHKLDEWVPRSLFTGSELDRLNLWLEIDTPANVSKALVVLEGEKRLPSGEIQRKPFVLAVTESTQDGVLRTGSIKHNDRNHLELQLELNPNRLPADLVAFRFKGIKVLTSYLQEAFFSFSH